MKRKPRLVRFFTVRFEVNTTVLLVSFLIYFQKKFAF